MSRPETENGEQGATTSCRCAGREPLGLGEHLVRVLDERIGRETAVGLAEVHRPA